MGRKMYLINGIISMLIGLIIAGYNLYWLVSGQQTLNDLLVWIIIGIALIVFGLIIFNKSRTTSKASA